jgi:hypothetical protein
MLISSPAQPIPAAADDLTSTEHSQSKSGTRLR